MPLPSWMLACLLAPFVGSFLGVLVMRHAAIGSALSGRSRCDACGAKLGIRDLVPVLSWAALRGRCRTCHAALGLFYPVLELAALGVAVWSAFLFSGGLLWASCCLGWTLLALAATDIKYLLLPDFLTVPLIAAGLLVSAAMDTASLADHAWGAAAGYLFVIALRFVYRHLRRREGMGLGDAKLLAAAGAWVSWTGLPSVLVIASVSGLAIVLAHSWLGSRPGDKVSLTDRVPFGAFLGAGLWIVWLYGPLIAG